MTRLFHINDGDYAVMSLARDWPRVAGWKPKYGIIYVISWVLHADDRKYPQRQNYHTIETVDPL